MESSGLFHQRHKLPSSASEETLSHILETLWKTRKTVLRPVDKSSIRSLLCLPSLQELDPLLACLHSLIRNLDIKNQWKEDVYMDRQTSGVPSTPPLLAPFSAAASEIDIVSCAQIACDTNISNVAASVPPRFLPCLNSTPTNRAAVITLKLQDLSKSPSGETEVKFQITKDTVEAMLRSMTYISDNLKTLQLGKFPQNHCKRSNDKLSNYTATKSMVIRNQRQTTKYEQKSKHELLPQISTEGMTFQHQNEKIIAT
ncbi:hypothetical protein MKX01_010876, partial [Papaver californicum]